MAKDKTDKTTHAGESTGRSDDITSPNTPKKKRAKNKPDLQKMISSLDAAAIKARIAEIESEASALRVLLSVAEARDKVSTPTPAAAADQATA